MVRSESASFPGSVQYGEVLNKVTSFLDHSLIYGDEESETRKIRSFVGGKINLGPGNLIPVDSNGKYTKISKRFTAVPVSAIWPTIFARNHNSLAEGLAKLNPKWSEEKLFQETRRLNIAVLQKTIFSNLFEVVFNKEINELITKTWTHRPPLNSQPLLIVSFIFM